VGRHILVNNVRQLEAFSLVLLFLCTIKIYVYDVIIEEAVKHHES